MSTLRRSTGSSPRAQVAADGGLDRGRCRSRRGAIPWSVGEHTDVWNHVEAAMALLVGGQVEAAERAFAWVPTMQRADGSWPMKIVGGEVEDHSRRVQHVGVRRGRRLAPLAGARATSRSCAASGRPCAARSTASCPCSCPSAASPGRRSGTTARPATVNEDALLAGSSSIYQSLRAGVALADLLGEPQPEWELAGGRLGHALREHRDLFLDKSTFSMDWYYPVLGGAVRGRGAPSSCSPSAGTTSSSPASASGASPPTRG